MSRLEMIPAPTPRLSPVARLMRQVRSFVLGPIDIKDPALKRIFSTATDSTTGIHVSLENAFTFSAVFDAVNQLSGDIAKLPLNLHKRRKDGGSDHYIESKLYRILKDEANPEMSSMVFRRTMQAHALTEKGAFAEIERDVMGRPIALWPLAPPRVEPFRDRFWDGSKWRSGPLQYRVDDDVVLQASDMLHIHGLGHDGVSAYPVIEMARKAIALALSAEQFGGAFFGNSSTFGGILTTEQDLEPEQEDDIRKAIESLHKRADRAFRLLVLGSGFKYEKGGVAPRESQMDELRDKQVEEVARFFNMPLHKLKLNKPGATSYASVEMSDLDYYKGPVITWVTLWEQELNRKLISPLEARQQFIKHNANAFLRGDIKSRFEALGIARDKGIINADEWRDWEDMNPQPDGQGKIFLVQQAMVPANRLNDVIDAQVAPKPAPAAPAGPDDTTPDDDEPLRAELQRLTEEVRGAREQLDTSIADLTAARTEQAAELATLTAALEQARADSDAAIARRDALQVTVDGLTADIASARAGELVQLSQITALTAERDAALAATAQAESGRQAAEARIATIQAECEDLTRAVALRDSQLSEAAESLASVTARAMTAEALAATEATRAEDAGVQLRAAEAAVRDATAREEALRAIETELRAAVAAANAACTAAQARAEAAVDDAMTARTEVETATMATAEAATARDAATAARTDALEQLAAAVAERQVAETERDASREALSALHEEVRTAVAAHAEAIQSERARLDAAIAQLATAQASHEARAVDAEQRATSRIAEVEAAHRVALEAQSTRATSVAAELAAASEELEALRATHHACLPEAARLTDELAGVRAAHTAAEAARATADQALVAHRTAERQRLTAMLAAHRALVLEAMGRIIRRETDRASRHQATPEKLRAWLESFYVTHEDTCQDVLLPIVRTHLAWAQSADDPVTVTRSYVRAHTAESLRQLRAVANGDPDDLHTTLERMLQRWEEERPSAFADRLLQEELEYVANYRV